MRVIFMGTPEFAVPSLRALARTHSVVAVYTRPDAVSGRGGARRHSAVKRVALELGLSVLEPRTLRDPEVIDGVRSHEADIIVVAAYGLILPPEVLGAAPFGAVNVHGSLLPRWRGAAPVQRALLAGDRELGVCIMRMEEGLDTGPYCVCRSTPADDKTAEMLTAELAELGADALVEAIQLIESDRCEWREQDESLVTYAEKISKHDVALDTAVQVEDAIRMIRASSPQAPSRLVVAGKTLTALHALRSTRAVDPGQAAADGEGLHLGMADGALLLTLVKPEGKGAMAACDWARGARMTDTTEWGPVS